MAKLATFPARAFTTSGTLTGASGFQLYGYEAGTTTPKAFYTDSTGTVAQSNPMTLPSSGTIVVWLGSGSYKFDLKDTLGVSQPGYPIDNIEGESTFLQFRLVSTIDDMKALESGESDYVFVSGKDTKGDGFSATYYWNSSSTASDDGLDVIEIDSAPATGRFLRLSQEAFEVESYASLRALPAGIYKSVRVAGRLARGDGGDGIFDWISTSTSDDDQGIILKPNGYASAGRWIRRREDTKRVNAVWFGLTGGSSSSLPQSQTIMTNNVKALMRATNSLPVGVLFVPGRDTWYGINSTIIPGCMVLATTLNSTVTSLTVDVILEETPQTGTLYISKDTRESAPISVSYTSWTGNTFTIASTDFSGNVCTAGNCVTLKDKLENGSNWQLLGDDGTIYWGGPASGRMFECSDPYFTFVSMEKIKLRGWYAGTVSVAESTSGRGFANEGANYGRTNIGHFHYYFSQITGTWFLANESSTPFALNPGDGGNNGGNDFEFHNCYFNFCGTGIILGLPDQSFINCTFQNVNIAVQMGANSRASFTRCYLGGLKAVFQIAPGCVGINVAYTWFEQTGTIIKYATPGSPVELPSGLNITDCRFANALSYGNVVSDYPVLLQQPSTLATGLTGVTTSIVASTVLAKETTTEGGIPERGFLRVYANGGGYYYSGTAYKVYYSSFNHGTKTFGGIKNHYSIATTLDSATQTSVVVEGSIGAHTKASGNLDITRDDGTITTVAYSSWTGSTFTITSTDFSTNNARAGKLVKADTDFTSVPASAGNLLQIQRNGSFLDTRDITGNINLRGGDFAGENANNDITVNPNYANVNIDNVKNSNYWPLRFVNTSGTDIEGGAGVYIKDSGRQSYGLKAKKDYGSEGDFISFTGTIATTGLANNTSAAYSFSLPGAILTQNRPVLTVYCYDTDRVFVTARVTAADTLSISVFNSTGGSLASDIKINGQYKSCLRNEILI